jgi:outer membrane protein TolC
MKKFAYISIIILFSSSFACAQEIMGLEKAIALGIENNYGIKINEAAIQIAENNNSWARAGKVPTVDLNGQFNNSAVNDNNPASFLRGTFYRGSISATLDANWVVYNGGRIKITKEQFENLIEQEQLNRQITIHDLLLQITQQYYLVILQQEQLEVLENNFQLSEDRLKYEKAKRDFGASNAYNLIQFENAVLSDSSTLINQELQVETAKRNLYNILDLDGFQNYHFPERLNVTPENIDRDKLMDILSEENYTLRTLEMISSLNRINTRLEEAARKPTINLFASGGVSENAFKYWQDDPLTGEPFELQFSDRFDAAIGANLNWNLYDGGVMKTNIENARLQEQIDVLSYMEAEVELQNQLDILVSNYNNQKQLLELTSKQVDVSQRNLEMTEERFRSGQLTSLDFRNVQTQYLNALFAKVSAIYNLIITKSEMDYLVGIFD